MIKDKLILLVEAQSTFNPNMALRFLIYIANTYQDYIIENAIYIYETKQITIPTPQFFLIYTGEKESPDTLKLSSLYADNTNTSLELSVKVLSENQENASIIGQYIRFCKFFDENKKGAKTKEEIFSSLRKTIDFCIENNILTDFLIRHRKEAMDFMISIFTEEQLRAMEKKEDFEEGLERGMIEGKIEGLLEVSKNLKKEGLPPQMIAKVTGLSLETIQNL